MEDVLAVIFSRDRAMQLDAMLRSLFLHCQDITKAKIYVLYKTTNNSHEKQYCDLTQEYSGRVNFQRQQSFKQDLISLMKPQWTRKSETLINWWLFALGWIDFPLGSFLDRVWRRTIVPFQMFVFTHLYNKLQQDSYVFFLVDDNIFVKNFFIKDIIATLRRNQNILGFSLRLGKNTTYCYSKSRKQALPEFIISRNTINHFNWVGADGDFGYPFEVSSSIYRSVDILPMLMSFPFDNPNVLEERMALCANKFMYKRPNLASYHCSVTFCNPVNVVQSLMPNRAGENIAYGVDELSVRFERGERIQVEVYNGFIPVSCHQEVELVFSEAVN